MSDSCDDRLDDLEVRFSFQEQTLDTLSDTVYRQSQLIEQLQRQLRKLEQQLEDNQGEHPEIVNQRPPHY